MLKSTNRSYMSVFPALLSLVLFFVMPYAGASATELVDYVDPFIGTGGAGFGVGSTYPGPTTVFGMVKPGPDTMKNGRAPGFNHCSGYYHKDNTIRGFSHTRMNGTGVPDYGNIMVMPTIGEASGMFTEQAYSSKFKNKTEVASPGYYAVTLEDTGIRVELTAGDYVAYHRYTYPETDSALLVVNASHFIGDGTPVSTEINVDTEKNEISGYFVYNGPFSSRGGGLTTYFFIQSAKPFELRGAWKDGEYMTGAASANGKEAGAVVAYDLSGGTVVEIKVAISFVSVDQAKMNMAADVPGWDFDALHARTRAQWEKTLSRVRVEGGPDKLKRIFYTSLYHAFVMPTLNSEAGGWYRGMDKEVHRAEGFRYYTDFSMWDTFRTLHPLISLIAPDYQRDFNMSLLAMYKDGGYIPKWPLGSNYTGCMIGTSADVVIADSYLKGITGFDIELAYRGLMKTALGPTPPGAVFGGRGGIKDYLDLGYVPADKHGGATSKTLEFAYDDYALSKLAASLGKYDDAEMFYERSKNYRNVWNPEAGFFDGRNSDGTFPKHFNDQVWADFYTEGTAWQWLWFVPHDVPGLMKLMGGRKAFAEKLDFMFRKSHKEPDTMMYDKYYWHGNEPDIYAPYLFLWAGLPHRTQEEVRWVMRRKYADDPAGLDGNDDGGTLSAWFVLSAMGFMPVPATNRYYIGSPIFRKVTVSAPNVEFTVEAKNVSGKRLYIKNAALNGKSLEKPYFYHRDLVNSGKLVFDMTGEPSGWGSSME